ncbi:hypothetical protein [Flavobacterium sp. ASV13]|uniref:hypothetical protein n=1 Tax=Flavobacterium sp. ASV13 TaxID=1506583 RepID=UPI000554DE1F|nr:hypothetical protein [Flavobacterium sp. ASV13]
MAIYNYRKEEEYQLKSAKNKISVSVISGNGQGGSYFILKDLEFVGANDTVLIGTANQLEGKSIQVLVTIQDKLIQTNWTGVIVIISEGGVNTFYNYAEELPADKDIACYYINIKINR